MLTQRATQQPLTIGLRWTTLSPMGRQVRGAFLLGVVTVTLALSAGVTAAGANPSLSFSYAKGQLTKFVVSRIVAADEKRGMDVRWAFDSCFRVSSSRVNCHLHLRASGTVPTTGDTASTYCSGTWTAFNQGGYFRIRNVTWACN
jgi:hypothetical protein